MTSAPVQRRLLALLTMVLLAVSSLATAAGVASADDTVGIAISPANDKGKPDGRTRFTYKADPGQTISDHVRVTNAGTTSLVVTVFAADAYNAENGDFALRPTEEKRTGAATWVKFEGKDQLKLTLKRGETRTVPFTVAIPTNATPGDHPAGVLAAASSSGQVKVDRRIANRMYVRVSGKLQPLLTISSFSGTYHPSMNPLDGSITVSATITNSGNVALEGSSTLSTTTWFGMNVGQTVRVDQPEILPGNTSTVTFEVKGVPQVGYGIVRMLVQGGISGDAPDPGPLPVIQRDAFVIAMPWLLLVAIVAGAGVWFLVRWRRKGDEQYAAQWSAQDETDAAKMAQEVGSR